MPEPTSEKSSDSEAVALRKSILGKIDNLKDLAILIKSLTSNNSIVLEDKVELMLLVFTAESKTPKYDLIPYLWNFLKILYNNMNKLLLKLIPAIAIDRGSELSAKQMILFKEITTRLAYVMVYMKDNSQTNLEIICKNVLVLSKTFLRDANYTEFFDLLKETFFNPKYFYQIKLFPGRAPGHDLFLEHLLTRLWEFRDVNDQDLMGKGLSTATVFEKFFAIFIFYVNYEAIQPELHFKLTDKVITVLLGLNIAKASKEIGNSIKCLYYLVQLMKGGSGQDNAVKGFYQYMARICDKTVLNSQPIAAETLATVGIVLEKTGYFNVEENLRAISVDSLRYLLQTIKLTVSLNVEPDKPVCELKDCVKGAKKHTITNLTRFAQKIFLAYVAQLSDKHSIDEDMLAIVVQLIIFHFHVMERLSSCSSRVANEHNDIRRLYSTFAHRTKANPHASILKIFEIALKYALQRNLSALVNPVATLLGKYYTETKDQGNYNRIEWISLLCLHEESSTANFQNMCYNWAVKKQYLTKEEAVKLLREISETKLDYQTELIPKNCNPREVFINIVESIAVHNLKAFRVLQEALVEIIMDDWTDCSEDVVNVLFYATESQILNYQETIERNKKHFTGHKNGAIPLAILHSLTYQIYIETLRKGLKSIDMSMIQSRSVDLSNLSVNRDRRELEGLRISLEHLIKSATARKLPNRETQQILGTLKRNIRFFQLAGLELEEVSACKTLYDLSKSLKDLEGQLLAMANLMNHVHFIIKDEQCRSKYPGLIRLITGEGSSLFCSQLKNIQDAKESLQILIVFGICNMIKLNADLGRREKSYDYLQYLKQRIDEINAKKEETSVAHMQYNLISYQLFLKYSVKSEVNHLMVAREIFSAVRLLQKVSDLYALYLYDVLVELFCFVLPRHEMKGLDFYICTVLKYFMGLGSVNRIMDVLLVYCNWALCCENLEKSQPVMEYMWEILARKEDEKEIVATGGELSLQMALGAVDFLDKNSPLRPVIVAFKLNCLVARQFYIERNYDQSRKLYEHAWNSYEAINERIANFAVKTELQQFFVNSMFQLSNVYYKMGMSSESLKFCKATTLMISDIRVNRIALAQEAHFQGLIFKPQPTISKAGKAESSCAKRAARKASPVSPIQLEMAMILNNKKTTAKSVKKKLPLSKDGTNSNENTPSKSRRAKGKTKTPAKNPAIQINPPDHIAIPILPAVDENSSLLGNSSKLTHPPEEVKKTKASTRRIPVRTNKSTTVPIKSIPSAPITKKQAATESSTATTTTVTRKTTRRMM